MPTVGLNHYNIKARQDLIEELRDFYVAVLGLRVGPRPPFPFPGYWLYAGTQALLHLVVAVDRDDPVGKSAIDHVALDAVDFDAMHALLLARAIDFKVNEVPGSDARQIFLRDPAGNRIELQFAARR